MRKFMILLLMFVIATTAFSQEKEEKDKKEKKEKKEKIDPEQAAIDSLTKANATLSATLDSVTKDRQLYYGLYTVIKDKVIKYNFNPARAAFLIDSLKQGRESILFDLNLKMHDTLAELNFENKRLMSELYKADTDREKLACELIQLKELLDAKIITQQEFDTKKAIVMQKWK
jgi:hypothetical protein